MLYLPIYIYIYGHLPYKNFYQNVGSFFYRTPQLRGLGLALSPSPVFWPPDTASSETAPPTASPPGHRAAAEIRHKASRRPHHIPATGGLDQRKGED